VWWVWWRSARGGHESIVAARGKSISLSFFGKSSSRTELPN
jgi:hypothetical protein